MKSFYFFVFGLVSIESQQIEWDTPPFQDTRRNFQPGVICNYDYYVSANGRVQHNYLCVPLASCRHNPYRNASIEYDSCDHHLVHPDPQSSFNTSYVCCHTNDIIHPVFKVAGRSYLPGVRSFMMCKHYSHTICREGESECYKDITKFGSRLYTKTPTSLNKHPHMALIGHVDKSKPGDMLIPYCSGTIVSEKHVLTSATCYQNYDIRSTHVAVGEGRQCMGCLSRDGEQTIEIQQTFMFPSFKMKLIYHDLAVVRLVSAIKFNKFVRPACISADPQKRYNLGSIAGYGKDDRGLEDILTTKNEPDVTYQLLPHFEDGTLLSFWLRTKGPAVITLTDKRQLTEDDLFIEVIIGEDNNTQSSVRIRKGTSVIYQYKSSTPSVLSHTQKKKFWIDANKGTQLTLGEGDKTSKPILKWTANGQDYDLALWFYLQGYIYKFYGISTPGDYGGDWSLITEKKEKVLYESDVSVIYFNQCYGYYANSSDLSKDYLLYDRILMCAWNQTNPSPCNEDYGSALLVTANTYCMWQVLGVMAKFPDDYSQIEDQSCGKDKPRIYTRLALYHLNWLEYIVWGRMFNSRTLKLETPLCSKRLKRVKRLDQC